MDIHTITHTIQLTRINAAITLFLARKLTFQAILGTLIQ